MPPRSNILLRRLAQPRRVSLPNGRTFIVRYERVNRASLYPKNVRIRRTYTRKIGPRRQRKPRKKQQEINGYIDSQNIIRGIDLGKRAANTGIDLEKRAANTEVGRMIVNDVVSLIPKGYKALKNKLFRRKKQQHLLNLINQLKQFLLKTINQFKYFLLETITQFKYFLLNIINHKKNYGRFE